MWHKRLLFCGWVRMVTKAPRKVNWLTDIFPSKVAELEKCLASGRSVATSNGSGCLGRTGVNRSFKLLGDYKGSIVAEGK